MNRRRLCAIALFALCCVLVLPGTLAGDQGEEGMTPEMQAMMKAWQEAATPGPEHEHLATATGRYRMIVRSFQGPDAEPTVSEGIAVREMILGGRVLVEHAKSEFMGQPFEGIGWTGYDNVTERYWSIWADNMSTGIVLMYGEWNDDGTGTFEGEAPDPVDGAMKPVRIEMRMDGKREIYDFFESSASGEALKTMEIVYEPLGD
jgi:hypothetical protein